MIWLQSSDLGLCNLMIQRIGAAHGKDDANAVARNFGTGMVLIFGISLLVGVVGVALSFALPCILRIEGGSAHVVASCFRWGSLACALMLLHFGFLGYFRAVQRTIAINLLSLIGTLLNLVVVVALLRNGWGLNALAAGMVVRSMWMLSSSAILFIVAEWKHFSRRTLYDTATRRDMINAVPATALGVLAFAVMNSSDSLVVSLILGNATVPAYTFTKKAADVLRSMLDMVAYAAYPGFAHLVGSEQRAKAPAVYRNIMAFFVLISVCAAVGYMTTNHVFVNLWVGNTFYLGGTLTTLFALQMIISSASLLVNYLYRSIDRVVHGSLVFSLEALAKLSAVCVGCYLLGVVGIPVGSIMISLVFIVANYRLTFTAMGEAIRKESFSKSIWIVPVICLTLGATYEYTTRDVGSLYQGAGGVLMAVFAAITMLLFMREARVLKQYVNYKLW
jgi:O-antigen/teichoic acid export membrane protein